MIKVTMVHLTRARKYERLWRQKKRFELFNQEDKADQINLPATGKFTKDFVDYNDLAFWIATSKASWWNGGRLSVELEWFKNLPRCTRNNLLRKASTIYAQRHPEASVWVR